MLEPQGFYDAIQAYHLPQSIIDLDQSSQENVPYRIKTAHGFTEAFIVNGVTKQGGSLSPLKCTLTMSMSNRWLEDELHYLPSPLPYHHSLPSDTLASDGSTIQVTPNFNATNFAVVTNGNAFPASISHHGSQTGILQGEAYGIAVTSLLVLHSPLHSNTLYSNHLNSVNFLNSQPQNHLIKNKPARSYYQWILAIWHDAALLNHEISLEHCKAHTSDNNLPATLNRLADHIASHSHLDPLVPSPLPPPTFSMDDFTLYSSSHGFIESNTSQFINNLLSEVASAFVDTYHSPFIPSQLFDTTTPPSYSYLHAFSSFSAVVQLYLHCGQLDTSLSLSCCFSDGSQPWCHFGCHAIEDAYHIFVHCPRFQPHCDSASSSLISSTTTLLDACNLPTTSRQAVLQQANGLFLDADTWPGQKTYYYLGVILHINLEDPKSHTKILGTQLANNWHTLSI
ncbi:hypothetical protein CPB84DRAFT_1840548 [Gymnopilus junonius]|uniref:RNase H type-1 domain-containing protein n=1 Tax=Gymnopilus junonius TaxID=109634 RepID=A0A9P5P3L4_GYMJU|nr:hypothetical protein CPB84DRAFT_1840548 [Gymnopilus junonius]